MAGWDYEQISPPLEDMRVDDIVNQVGPIDNLPALSLDITDAEIIKNLNGRIDDAQSYWDKPEGFNLREARNENTRLHLGKQIDVTHLYRFQVPYVENEIFVGEEAIVAYLTAQNPQPEVSPAQDTQRSKIFAADLEKFMMAHSQKFYLNRLLEVSTRNLLNKRIGVIKLEFDPAYGPNGEIVPKVIDPDHLIIDKNAEMGSNPAFICHVMKFSVEELCFRWPEKKQEIFAALGIVRGTAKQMSQEVAVRQVWVTHYDKGGKPEEGCVTYFGKCVLSKYRNPNWLYAEGRKNFLDMPMKPFIPLNYINYGQHWIDITTPIEQAANMQNILNKRGRQIMENADKANGMLIISTDSGLTKDDAQNLTGDPNQKLIIKTAGQPVGSLVYQVPPHDLPAYVMADKQDQRTVIHSILGTPDQFTGSNSQGDQDAKTLGESIMVKNQAAGRQDLIVRAIDNFMDRYFKFLAQMMVVWYDEKHTFVYNGGDGDFDYITMSRDLFEDGIAVNVKSGTTLPFDKGRQEAVALNLAKMGMISPLDLFRDLHMDNPQKRYDNWYKWKTNPESLARDANDAMDESTAYIDYIEIMDGKDAKPREDAKLEHVLTHRKQMTTDEFLKAPRKRQEAFAEHLQKEVTSLTLRTILDEMSQAPGEQGEQNMNPQVPIQPPQPPMPMGGAMPPSPGMMPPGVPPMGGAMPPPGGMPGMPPMPPPGAPMGVNPMAPNMPPPGNPAALPPVM